MKPKLLNNGCTYAVSTMDKDKCKRRKYHRGGKRYIRINMRMNQARSDWLKENEYSPTAVFDEACRQLGFQE